MTPRTEVDWIDVSASPDELRAALQETPHSRIPVAEGSVDNIVGVVQTRDLLEAAARRPRTQPARAGTPAPVIPDLMDAMDALAVLRSAECRWRSSMTNMAISTGS